MVISNRCFEQYCIYKNRNVRMEELFFLDGKRITVCHESRNCKKCKNRILPHCSEILKIY